MFIAKVKYSRQAIPTEYKFDTETEARQFCKDKEMHNPYVRWTEVEKTK